MTNTESVDADKGAPVDTAAPSELDQLKQQIEYFKGEAKKAFADRDEAKKASQALQEQLKAPKSGNKDDLITQMERLESEKSQLAQKLSDIEQERIRERKVGELKEAAKRSGLKERYLGQLSRLLGEKMADVDPDRPITIKLALDGLKTEMPDVFDADTSSRDFPAPRLRTDSTTDALKAELEAEYAKPAGKRNYQVMMDLENKIKNSARQ